MPRIIIVFSLVILSLVALAKPSAYAASEATRSKNFAAGPIASISLKAAVGGVRIEPGRGDDIEVSVALKAKRTTGIFSALPDVSTLDISATTRGDELSLEVDAKNIEEQWLIRLPRKSLSAIEITLGVGNVSVSAPAGRFDIDVGVGDATINIPSGAIAVTVGTGDARITTKLADAGAIKGKTGVGSTELNGVKGSVKSSRVGGNVTGQGQGTQPIEATVGVGDLAITLIE